MLDSETTTDAIPSPPRSPVNVSATDNSKSKPKVVDSDDEYEKDKSFEEQHKDESNEHAYRQINHNTMNINGGYVQFGNNITLGCTNPYCKNPENCKNPKGRRIEETEKIKMFKNSCKPVTPKDNELISHYMSKDWKDTARALGYSDSELDHFTHNPTSLKETIYKFLRNWIENKGRDIATVGLLARTLWGNQQRETVEKWSEEYDKIHKVGY